MLVEPRAMTEDELIKKVAREMAGALGARVPYDMLPEDASQPKLADGSRLTKEVLLDGARAALAAIREALNDTTDSLRMQCVAHVASLLVEIYSLRAENEALRVKQAGLVAMKSREESTQRLIRNLALRE
jgi:hypothetical protein